MFKDEYVLYYGIVKMVVTFPVGYVIRIDCFRRDAGRMGCIEADYSDYIDYVRSICNGSENAARDLYKLCCKLGITW